MSKRVIQTEVGTRVTFDLHFQGSTPDLSRVFDVVHDHLSRILSDCEEIGTPEFDALDTAEESLTIEPIRVTEVVY